MSRATLIDHRKRVYDARVEVRLHVQPFYGRPGLRLIGYDNEAGKGDHRHYEDQEEVYRSRRPAG